MIKKVNHCLSVSGRGGGRGGGSYGGGGGKMILFLPPGLKLPGRGKASGCRSSGREFHPSLVPYFRED